MSLRLWQPSTISRIASAPSLDSRGPTCCMHFHTSCLHALSLLHCLPKALQRYGLPLALRASAVSLPVGGLHFAAHQKVGNSSPALHGPTWLVAAQL